MFAVSRVAQTDLLATGKRRRDRMSLPVYTGYRLTNKYLCDAVNAPPITIPTHPLPQENSIAEILRGWGEVLIATGNHTAQRNDTRTSNSSRLQIPSAPQELQPRVCSSVGRARA